MLAKKAIKTIRGNDVIILGEWADIKASEPKPDPVSGAKLVKDENLTTTCFTITKKHVR